MDGMQHDAPASGWIMSGGFPASPDALAAILKGASEPGSGGVADRVPVLSAVHPPLDEADRLNKLHEGLPEILRRILRRQGRLNRRVREAALALASAFDAASRRRDRVLFAEVYDLLDTAQRLQHQARGSAYNRRLHRPQHDFNRCLNAALTRLADLALDSASGLAASPSAIEEKTPHIRWHIQEALHLNSLHANEPTLLRRIRRDQHAINRCHIITLSLLCELASRD